LLDSYNPKRSAVGDEVLKTAGRLTAVATPKNPLAQSLRNMNGSDREVSRRAAARLMHGWSKVAPLCTTSIHCNVCTLQLSISRPLIRRIQ